MTGHCESASIFADPPAGSTRRSASSGLTRRSESVTCAGSITTPTPWRRGSRSDALGVGRGHLEGKNFSLNDQDEMFDHL